MPYIIVNKEMSIIFMVKHAEIEWQKSAIEKLANLSPAKIEATLLVIKVSDAYSFWPSMHQNYDKQCSEICS